MKRYFVDDCLRRNVVLFGKKVTPKVVSNRDHQLRILHENHGSTIGGHSAENKTYNKIRVHFYWPNLRSDIKELAHFL